jgi:hypothetical protein
MYGAGIDGPFRGKAAQTRNQNTAREAWRDTEVRMGSNVIKTHEFVASGGDGCQQCGFGPGALQHNTSQPEWPRTMVLSEAINHPSHYGGDTVYEAIKVIEAWRLGFRLGNVLKYIKRSQHKDNYLENLQKARWYLDREIAAVEATLYSPSLSTRTSHPDPQSTSIQTTNEDRCGNLL